MPKSTTHHSLATLISRGFIEKVNDDSYALGTAIITLSQAVRVNAELRDRAAPLLRELAEIAKESVYLTYFDGSYILYIYAVESSKRLMARTAVGEQVRLHCTANGKSILAALSPDQVNDIMAQTGMPRFTHTTITDIALLHSELEASRQRGYAVDVEEHELGTFCLGAVIRNAAGEPIGGCSVSGADESIVHDGSNELAADLLYVGARDFSADGLRTGHAVVAGDEIGPLYSSLTFWKYGMTKAATPRGVFPAMITPLKTDMSH